MPKHRRASSLVRRLSTRAAHVTLAGSVGTVAMVAAQPAVAADNVWDRVADCESSGNWSINSQNGFYGGLQFVQSTWVGFGGQAYAPYAHQATKLQQITIAQKVLKVQGPGAWPVCSVRAGLTMENGSAPYPGSTTTPAPAPAPGVAGTWYVAASPAANVRSGPSTGYGIVGTLARGTKVTGTMSNGWVKISDGRFISGATLTTTAPAAATPSPAPGTAGTWTVSSSIGANVRSGPGTSHAVVGGLGYGSKVTGTLANGWVKMAEGRYISAATLTTATSGTVAPAPSTTGTVTYRVNVSVGANVRSGPGTSYAVIGGLANGTQVKGGAASNGWVKLSDRAGWVSASLLTKVG